MNNIQLLVVHLMRRMGNYMTYGQAIDFSMVDLHEQVKKEIPITVETFDSLTVDQAKACGFQLFSEEMPDVYCIPTYLYTFIPEGLKVTGIDGEEFVVNKVSDLDNDNRFGALAYGITIKGEKHE